MGKFKIAMMVMAAGCCGVLLSGCGPREPQQVVVQQQPQKVVEKETIKVQPTPQAPKTVIVKSAPAPKTTVKTDVEVKVEPAPKSAAPKSVAPKPTPTAKPIIKPAPTSTPRPKIAVKPKPTPTPTPRPKPTATPRPQSTSKNLVVRAEVVATSKVPDPKTVPYRESLVFTKYKVLSVQSGKYAEKEILVAQWGMKDKKLQPAARNRVGQVQTLSLEPLAAHSELESVMRNDDTEEFELEPYFAK